MSSVAAIDGTAPNSSVWQSSSEQLDADGATGYECTTGYSAAHFHGIPGSEGHERGVSREVTNEMECARRRCAACVVQKAGAARKGNGAYVHERGRC